MRFVTIGIFAVTSRLVALATAKPIPNWMAGGVAIPLARHSSSLNNKSLDLDTISSHGISVREKILRGLDNYEMNTGTIHPLAVKRSESRLGKRGGGLPLTTYEDEFWIGEISIGIPPQTLKVQIDTGAADLWVLETGSGVADKDHNLWDPQSSKSAKYQGQTFELSYADGAVIKGVQYTDTVTIAGFTANPQTLGSATSFTSVLHDNEYPADGLLGLAFPSISKFSGYPLFLSLVTQNRLINPTFSLKLTSSGAEIYIGGANSMLYNGDIAYTPVTHPGLWEVSMDDVRVNGIKILENVPVILDTGANYIFGDWERVSNLYEKLGGILMDEDEFGFYYLPCNSFPTLSFTFGGRSFEIPPDALRLKPIDEDEDSPNCFSAIVGERSPSISEISQFIAS